MQRASVLLQAGNFPLARAILEQVIATAPNFVEARRLLAGALQALGDRAGAERELRIAVSIDPDWAPTLTSLGELLIATQRSAEAETSLRRAIDKGRGYPRAALMLARLLNDAGRPQEAFEVTTPIREHGPSRT